MKAVSGWFHALGVAGTKVLPLVFLLCALPTGLGVVLLTPIGGVSDEPQHIARADGLLSGQILGTIPPWSATAGVFINTAIFAAQLLETRDLLGQPLPDALRAQARAVRWGDDRFGALKFGYGGIFASTQMVRYFPAFYVPGALGIATGQALRIKPLYTLFLGRGFMLLSYLAMGAAALHVARRGRALLFTVLTLPMTLYLAGSFNQDGQMIGAAALAASLLTRHRPGPSRAWLLALLLLTLIACAKAPYAWLVLACMLPMAGRNFAWRLGLALAAAALCGLWLWAARRANAWPWPRLPYHPGPLWPGSHAVWLTATSARGNMQVLLAHPGQIVWLPMHSIINQAPALGQELIGKIGWEAFALAPWLYAGWTLALAVSLTALMVRDPTGAPWAWGVCLILLLATVLSISLSAYVTFTNLGATEIDGLRGRYFLPVLPFLLFVLPLAPRWRAMPVISWIASVPIAAYCLPAVIMAVIDIYALPAQIFHVFRMGGP